MNQVNSKFIEEKANQYAEDINYGMSGFNKSIAVSKSSEDYSAGYNQAVKDLTRWRKVSKELPEDTFETYVDGKYRYTKDSFLVKTINGKYAITSRVKFFNNTFWEWKGSGTFNSSIVEWMPIPE